MEKPKVLIVKDANGAGPEMKSALEPDYTLFFAENRSAAMTLLKRERPTLIILVPGSRASAGDVAEGTPALPELLRFDPFLKIVVIIGDSDKKNAIDAVAHGAHDFLCKPFNTDELKIILSRALYISKLERERLEIAKPPRINSFDSIMGASPEIQAVFAAAQKIATTDAPVLIAGERGSGKELIAHAIHDLSSRRNEAFVALNCGAIPENLLEGELFGHERTAIAGADAHWHGRIEMAQSGTLFLDEIEGLSPVLQEKVLRFLRERQIERLGSKSPIHIDARVIAATNIDLQKAKIENRFREDLYHRLAVVVIDIPPLRDRQGDISLLATAFLQRYATAHNKTLSFTQGALKALETHRWPGNVRELESRIQRAVIMAENGKVMPEDLELTSRYAEYQGKGLAKARQALERYLIEEALGRNKGNISRAAVELEISRPTLYELMDRLRITRKSA